MLFLPPQTTKCCANWWCHSLKNLATCYSKLVLVLVPIYCSKLLFAINKFFLKFFFLVTALFFILFFFQLISLFPLQTKVSLSLSLSLSQATLFLPNSHSLPTTLAPSVTTPRISLLGLMPLNLIVWCYVWLNVVINKVILLLSKIMVTWIFRHYHIAYEMHSMWFSHRRYKS